jgi:uncharacterized protein
MKKHLHLPNLITFSRFIFGVLMILAAYQKSILFFILFYIIAFSTDILDGFFARKMKKESEFGKRFDIVADNFILLCLAASFYLMKKEVLFTYSLHLFFLLGYYVFVQIICLIFTRKILFMRTYSANLAAILFPFMIFGLFFFQSGILVYPFIMLMLYSLSEKMIIHITKQDKKSIFEINSANLKILFFAILGILTAILFILSFLNTSERVCFRDAHCVSVEIKDSDEERALGLMFRENMTDKEGMLFIFDSNVSYPFWMKNMKMPIDIIFIGQNKKIISISENAIPCTKPDAECELYYPAAEYMYVVETVSGFSRQHKLENGQEIYFSPGIRA